MSDVFVDGKLIGQVTNASKFKKDIIAARRTNKFSTNLNISYIDKEDKITINLDKDRLRRPLIIVEKGKPLLTEDHIKAVENKELTWNDLVKQGIIEYLDANEEEDALVALTAKEITNEHTHLELDPVVIFGICTSIVPYANYNQSSRLNRGSKTQKQAMGVYATNFMNRMDTNVNVLHHPQKPLVKSATHEIFGEEKSAGQNITVAVTNYQGYNVEDALVFNKASIDRGLGRSTRYRPYSTEKLRYAGGQIDEIRIPDKDVQGYTTEHAYRYLNEEGICYPEVKVEGSDVLIGKTSPPRFLGKLESFSTAANLRKDTSVKVRPNEKGIVSQVVLTESGEGNMLVKVNVRDTRLPEVGDKFASRHGQKGIIGAIIPPEDMPFTASGIVPDVIFSPTGLPSRLTVGHMIELIGGKVGALAGRYIDGTPFTSEPAEKLRQELIQLGFKEDGTEALYDGRTGKLHPAKIFIGNIYYLRLKHQVKDKLQARARGPVQLLTRQPTEGKAKEGGLRLGEMEKEALVGHGASLLIKERFDSDRTIVHICEKCGDLAVHDKYRAKSYCLNCGEKTKVSPIEISYAFKLFLDELKSLCIKPKLILKSKY